MRSQNCSKCKVPIDGCRIKQGYCKSCHAVYERHRRATYIKPAIKRVRKITCSKCTKPLEENRVGKDCYCKTCHSEYTRLNNKKYYTEATRVKGLCRSKTVAYIKRGKLFKEPCYNCGNPDVQAHHSDYSSPLKVHWLCKICHIKLHHDHNIEHKINSMPATPFKPVRKYFKKIVPRITVPG